MFWALRFLTTLLPILYGVTGFAYLWVFLRDDPLARRLAPRCLGATVLAHALFLGLLTAHVRRVPVATSFELLSALAFALAIAYLVQEQRSRTPHTGLLFVPLIFLCQTVASAFLEPNVEVHRPILQSSLFGLHIGAVLLGYAAFAVSAVYGLLFVLLYHELRSRRFGLVYERLPSLEVLSAMNVRAALFGVLCLTLAIAAGALMSLQIYPRFWQDPKLWFTVATWVVYVLCVLAWYVGGWRGTKIAWCTIAGFLLAVFSMLAVNRLFPSFHDFRI